MKSINEWTNNDTIYIIMSIIVSMAFVGIILSDYNNMIVKFIFFGIITALLFFLLRYLNERNMLFNNNQFYLGNKNNIEEPERIERPEKDPPPPEKDNEEYIPADDNNEEIEGFDNGTRNNYKDDNTFNLVTRGGQKISPTMDSSIDGENIGDEESSNGFSITGDGSSTNTSSEESFIPGIIDNTTSEEEYVYNPRITSEEENNRFIPGIINNTTSEEEYVYYPRITSEEESKYPPISTQEEDDHLLFKDTKHITSEEEDDHKPDISHHTGVHPRNQDKNVPTYKPYQSPVNINVSYITRNAVSDSNFAKDDIVSHSKINPFNKPDESGYSFHDNIPDKNYSVEYMNQKLDYQNPNDNYYRPSNANCVGNCNPKPILPNYHEVYDGEDRHHIEDKHHIKNRYHISKTNHMEDKHKKKRNHEQKTHYMKKTHHHMKETHHKKNKHHIKDRHHRRKRHHKEDPYNPNTYKPNMYSGSGFSYVKPEYQNYPSPDEPRGCNKGKCDVCPMEINQNWSEWNPEYLSGDDIKKNNN